MFAIARSFLLSGVTVVAASAIAVAPAVQAPPPPPIAMSQPVQLAAVFGPGTIVNSTVDVITDAAVGVVNLYYPIRDIGQTGINIANAIVFNPYIQVWPVTAIMSQVNMAWYLGVGIGNVTVPFIDDIIRVPQRVLDGQPSIQPVIASGYNLLNTAIPLVINYGLDQLQFFTGIYIIRVPVPFFPPAPTSIAADTEVEPSLLQQTSLVENVDEKPTLDAAPADTKPVDTKPVDVKPVETKPIETKPVDTKPLDIKPVETTLVDVKAEAPEPAKEPVEPEKKPTVTTNGIVSAQGEIRDAATVKAKTAPADEKTEKGVTTTDPEIVAPEKTEPVKAEPATVEPPKAEPSKGTTTTDKKDTDTKDAAPQAK